MVADAVGFEPVSSLQMREMQGDFAKMQGATVATALNLAGFQKLDRASP
jgi:hypothetical protein